MARSKRRTSAQLNARKQSTGIRPLIALSVISILLLTFYIREGDNGPIRAVRSGVSFVVAPVRIAGSVAASPFNALGNIAANLTASQKSLRELEDENARLTAQVATLSEAQATATRLEGLLGLKSSYDLTSTAARVIGESSDAWTRTVTLDKGSSDGITEGMAVCSAHGVIGQVIEVSTHTATVLLITDETSGVSAMVQSSRAQGMLKGQADGTLRLSYVPADAQVAVGDIIITSGIGGVFPKGLPLGTVTSVEKSDNDVYYTIVVRAQATAENNEEVLVVTEVQNDQKASDTEVAQANSNPTGSSNTESNDSSNTSNQASSSSSASGQTDAAVDSQSKEQ